MSKQDNIYSSDELRTMIRGMTAVSHDFYPAAVRVGNHAFIEFCGLMNEYIKLCQQTVKEDGDFTMGNVHTGRPLVAHDFNIRYIAEKFECIFGPTLQDPKLRAIFMEAMGWNDQGEQSPGASAENAAECG